jgi:AbrB family looped-hinge helix DNA binding protein
MPISKLGQRRQVVIPKDICDELGLEVGDYVEVNRIQNTVVLKPKKLVDAEEILTPKQRKIIDERLTEAEEDIRAGRVSGPFNTVEELMQHLKAVEP